MDDGLFEVVFLRPSNLRGWLQIVATVFWRNAALRRSAHQPRGTGPRHEVRAIHYRLGRTIDIRLDEPRRIEIDGDGFGTANSVRAWIEPEGLTIRVPQHPAAEKPHSASLYRR